MLRTDRADTLFNLRQLSEEAVSLLRDYVAIDTTNPPGDVSKAADWVATVLAADGIATTRIDRSPTKANLVATLPGVAGQPLVLAHHMDVVRAVDADWSVAPFGGELHDGYIWGRGTLDMKGFGVLTLVCALSIKRAGLPLQRPLRVLATADEEVGGIDGAKWLVENHMDEVGGEYLLTEGSFARAGPRATYYAVQAAEKGVSTMKLTARGLPGHASSPRDDNAIIRIARALSRIGAYRSPPAAIELARRFLSGFPSRVLGMADGMKVTDLTDLEMEDLLFRLSGGTRVQNMLRNTYVPTMVNAGLGQNVIPPICEAFVDCRSVPGISADDILAELNTVIDDPEVALELVKSSIGTESNTDTELMDAIREAVHVERPDAIVVPYLTSGGTDCKHFRPHGIVCYGHIPFELDDKELEGIHGVNERVSLENLDRGLRILMHVVLKMCAEPK
jgi:acetylornithine deacetylase/succinyl-diaminopimelate desuccinylase-like protein